jgi:hypothetical protein
MAKHDSTSRRCGGRRLWKRMTMGWQCMINRPSKYLREEACGAGGLENIAVWKTRCVDGTALV